MAARSSESFPVGPGRLITYAGQEAEGVPMRRSKRKQRSISAEVKAGTADHSKRASVEGDGKSRHLLGMSTREMMTANVTDYRSCR